MEAAVHLTVRGVVQGVGFRWFVMKAAGALRLRGYVRNLWDGEVEVEAEGERPGLESLIAEVKRGPRSARVTDVQVEWKTPAGEYTRFEIR